MQTSPRHRRMLGPVIAIATVLTLAFGASASGSAMNSRLATAFIPDCPSAYVIPLRVGACTTLFRPTNPGTPRGGDPAIGTCTIDPVTGFVTVCGVSAGTTTWSIEVTMIGADHEPYRCILKIKLVVT